MLVRYTPTQIASLWTDIKHAIEVSMPPISYSSPEQMTNILESLLSGSLHCWVAEDYTNDEVKRFAVMVTTFSEDSNSKVKNLLIYSLYGFNQIPDSEWVSGFETLREFAKQHNCNRIIAYSDVEKIIKMVTAFGGNSSYRFLTMDL